jgi:hypothetical protein
MKIMSLNLPIIVLLSKQTDAHSNCVMDDTNSIMLVHHRLGAFASSSMSISKHFFEKCHKV